jgi:hypothetical protein
MNSIASNSPIVREIVFRIIASGEIINTREKHRIDNDVVPSMSSKVHALSRGFQESVLKVPMVNREKPLQTHVGPNPPVHLAPNAPSVILEGYGRLLNLIRDPSISSIEYLGENLPIKITRMGKIQNTNIVLSEEELQSIIKYISSKTRIPVDNQVFKVALDNVLFNAIISPEVGTRFLIKKNFQISPDYSEAFK